MMRMAKIVGIGSVLADVFARMSDTSLSLALLLSRGSVQLAADEVSRGLLVDVRPEINSTIQEILR